MALEQKGMTEAAEGALEGGRVSNLGLERDGPHVGGRFSREVEQGGALGGVEVAIGVEAAAGQEAGSLVEIGGPTVGQLVLDPGGLGLGLCHLGPVGEGGGRAVCAMGKGGRGGVGPGGQES